jgi:hypothetical protein
MEMIPEWEAPVLHEAILADTEPKIPQLHLYHALMRDYEENPLRMEDDFDDLDDNPNDRDWVIKSKVLSLCLRISF